MTARPNRNIEVAAFKRSLAMYAPSKTDNWEFPVQKRLTSKLEEPAKAPSPAALRRRLLRSGADFSYDQVQKDILVEAAENTQRPLSIEWLSAAHQIHRIFDLQAKMNWSFPEWATFLIQVRSLREGLEAQTTGLGWNEDDDLFEPNIINSLLPNSSPVFSPVALAWMILLRYNYANESLQFQIPSIEAKIPVIQRLFNNRNYSVFSQQAVVQSILTGFATERKLPLQAADFFANRITSNRYLIAEGSFRLSKRTCKQRPKEAFTPFRWIPKSKLPPFRWRPIAIGSSPMYLSNIHFLLNCYLRLPQMKCPFVNPSIPMGYSIVVPIGTPMIKWQAMTWSSSWGQAIIGQWPRIDLKRLFNQLGHLCWQYSAPDFPWTFLEKITRITAPVAPSPVSENRYVYPYWKKVLDYLLIQGER